MNKVENKKRYELLLTASGARRLQACSATKPGAFRLHKHTTLYTYENDLFHVSIAGGPFDSCQQLDCHRTTAHHFLNFLALRVSGVVASQCHETLKGRGLLKSHGLSETPIVWTNTSVTLTRDDEEKRGSRGKK